MIGVKKITVDKLKDIKINTRIVVMNIRHIYYTVH